MPLKAGKSPSEALSLTNRVVLNPRDVASFGDAKHLMITLPTQARYVFTVQADPSMTAGYVGFSAVHRKWGGIDVNSDLGTAVYPGQDYIAEMTVDIDFQNKKKVTKECYNTDDMVKEFLMQFPNQAFSGKFPKRIKSIKCLNITTI